MYNCQNCGGNLRFDISSQMLKCPYCDAGYDCYEAEPAAETGSSCDVTEFSCPQCGAVLLSTDKSISEFCSYCGSSVVLTARMDRLERPARIIPFQKTREDCISAYRQKLAHAPFAPSQLKDPAFLEKFRGIYMPFWSYGFRHQGKVSLTGTRKHREGNYEITDRYRISSDVDASYDGICFDASSAFDDNISRAAAPYDSSAFRPFTPSYLSGFYADMADVPADLYLDEANAIANEETIRTIAADPVSSSYDLTSTGSLESQNRNLNTVIEEPRQVLLPVWFLSWRDKNRVAYITVNGQTGKVVADIPVDIRKYVAASVLLAFPLFFLLDLLVSVTAPAALLIAGMLSLATGLVYYREILKIYRREIRSYDSGYQYLLRKKKKSSDRNAETKKTDAEKAKGLSLSKALAYVSVFLSGLTLLIIISSSGGILSGLFGKRTIGCYCMLGACLLWKTALDNKTVRKMPFSVLREMAGALTGALAAGLISLIHPVSDIIYYAGMLLVYLGSLLTLIRIIRRYNLLITRPAPELFDRGKEH